MGLSSLLIKAKIAVLKRAIAHAERRGDKEEAAKLKRDLYATELQLRNFGR
jgi:hypothetical protein